jgi:Tfp pilus assembly protein PilP
MSRRLVTNYIAIAAVLSLGLFACGGEETPVTQERGMGGKGIKIKEKSGDSKSGDSKSGDSKAGGSRRSSSAPQEEQPEAPAELEFERPKRADLTRDDFSGRARDPFHNYLAAETVESLDPVEIVRKERDVKLSEYTFEELRLIAIVNAGRSVAPRALFLSSDNKSKSVKQGEYFSSAEVLLASVNRDYIEIEIVDPELTPGWNLERGERRVIYLKDE